MKSFYLILALAALAVTLCGCPAPSEGGTTGGKTATSTSPATTEEVADAGEAVAEEVSHPLLDVELDLVPVDWELNGISLGDGYEEYMLTQPEEANSNAMWIKEGVLGMLNMYNTEEDRLPEEISVYQDGYVISVMRTEEMDPDTYAIELADAMSAYGDYTEEPPEWAMDSALFEDGFDPEEGVEMSFWGDEDARAMMMYGFDTENSVAARMIVYIDHHVDVVDATMQFMSDQMEAMIAEQMEAMAAEQAAKEAAAGEGEGEAGETPFEIVDEAGGADGEATGEEGTETEAGDGEEATE